MSVGERPSLEAEPGLSQDDELTRVLADYLAQVEAGRVVDPEEWIEQHPAIARRLRTCLAGLHLVEEFAGSIGSQMLNREPLAEGPTLGDFRIVRALGRGGMGVVYEAVQGSLDRRVALKVLPFGAAIDPRRLARFRVESQAAAQLNHPHIIPVYSVGAEAGVHYYAMQLIDGITLAELIAELGRMKEGRAAPAEAGRVTATSSIRSSISTDSPAFSREAAKLGVQAALALDHAHENGVLHRDIKPSNLMIDGTGHLWVADFGLARFQTDASLTVSGDILGTLRYMSPEQALGNRGVVDQRTDVYSLGATLYELITLAPAFEGSNRQDLLRKIAQDEPRRPRALRPEVPLDLETIVLKAMAKDPASRYPTAGELALDLERFLDDQPIRARRPGAIERLTRLARKHMALVMAVVPLLVLIVAGLMLGIVLVLAKTSQILGQQVEIRNQKLKAEALQKSARRQRDVARRAVDEMYTLVAQDWISKQTNLQPLQRNFLQKALEYYREFASQKESDPGFRIAEGWAYYRLGDIQRRLGKVDLGEQGYRQAIEVLEALGKGKPPTPELLEPLAGSYAVLGEVLDETGRAEESKTVLERAIDLWRMLIDATPETPANSSLLAKRYEQLGTSLGRHGQHQEAGAAFRKAIALGKTSDQPTFTQARSIWNLAVTLKKQGSLTEAERLYREAIEQYEALIRRAPDRPLFRERLAEALVNLGEALSKDSKELEPILRRAQDIYQGLSAANPDVAEHRRNLASTLFNLASLFNSAGRLDEAELAARQARILLERLVAESPTLVRDQEFLARCLSGLARVRAQAGQTAAALADATQARQLYDKLHSTAIDLGQDRGRNLINLAQLQERSAKFAEADKSWRQAAGQFEMLVNKAPGRLDLRSDLAYQLTQLALSSARQGRKVEAERDLRRAVEIFEQLVSQAPERSDDRARLAWAAYNFARFLFENNRHSESDRFSRVAFQEYERLFNEHYKQDLMVRACADCMTRIANSQVGMGRFADAVNSYRESLKLFDSLPPKVAFEPTMRDTRGNVLDNMGKVLMLSGRFKEAEPRIEEALKIRESLIADFPSEPRYQDPLGVSKMHLGEILANRGEAKAARRLLEQAVELGQKAVKALPQSQGAQGHLRGERKSLTSFLKDQGAYVDCASVTEELLRDHSAPNRIDLLTEVASNLGECAFLAAHDEKLSPGSRQAVALPYAKRALAVFEEAAKDKKTTSGTINLAWFRLVCPVVALRNPGAALRLARELTTKAPKRADSWTILGAALYHGGQCQAALDAFDEARKLDGEKFGFWDFYVAMANWDLGHNEEARAGFGRAQEWMKRNPTSNLYERIRAQAESVMNSADSQPVIERGHEPDAKPR
jgi:eukaryotic-like serine/threonine-protein kinase